jgi:ATP-binding cassette, subfamily B, bacterial
MPNTVIIHKFSAIKILAKFTKLIFQASYTELIIQALINSFSGISSTISIYLNKIIIDDLTDFIKVGSESLPDLIFSVNPKIFATLLLMLLINQVSDSLNPIANIYFPRLTEKLEGFIKEKIMEKISKFKDISLFENPKLLDILKLSENSTTSINEAIYFLMGSFSSFFILVPPILLSTKLAIWIPFLLIITTLPSTIIDFNYRNKSWDLEESFAEEMRYLRINENMFLDQKYSKEIRLFSLDKYFLINWKTTYKNMIYKLHRLRFKGAIFLFISSVIQGVGIFIPYVAIASGVSRGNYTIGDFVLFTGLILQIRHGLNYSFDNLSRIYGSLLSIRPIFQLLEFKPTILDGKEKLSIHINGQNRGDIQISNMSFTYPTKDIPTLRNINLDIHSNEMLVIVGENGSGKTTLAKLLCRFYDPQIGSICWNGQNINTIQIDDLRSYITAVFQDFVKFPATLKENVAFGNLNILANEVSVQSILRKVNLSYLENQLTNGLNTHLSTQFTDGSDLSGGQWQRLAIARALARIDQAELFILDEPTSAIDPESEYEIYNLLRNILKNKMSVIISHRLSLAKISDRIIVLENGQIVEQGTHEQLMSMRKNYHSMFTKQMSQYI